MKSCDMVIIVPVDGITGEEAMRVQVWETVAELLRPELGKLYRQFNPSGSVWEHKYPRPFGVVLGRQEPEVFRELLKAGEEAQHEAAAYHLEAMIRKADLGSTQKIGNMQFYSTVVDGSDPELLAHGAWHTMRWPVMNAAIRCSGKKSFTRCVKKSSADRLSSISPSLPSHWRRSRPRSMT